MKVVIGLGNPGEKYEQTRHNIGFQAIDALAEQLQIPMTKVKCKGLIGEGSVKGEKVVLLKPLTYMNLSGESVQELVQYYKIDLDQLLVIYDDLDLPKGAIKLRMKGGAGGHNGIKSIIAHLGTENFKRIKIGIHRPVNGDIIAYVLGRFTSEEQPLIKAAIKKTVQAGQAFIEEQDFSKVMNIYNV